MENNYIEEWVRYYKELGVDKIVLFDNNDPKVENVLDVEYIKEQALEGFVIVVPQPKKRGMQTAQFTECYNLFHKDYDWLTFLDIDEYLVLKEHKNIKEYLAQEKFNGFDMIHVQWKIYDDNNLVTVQTKEDGTKDYSIMKRFTHPFDVETILGKEIDNHVFGYFYHKTILRGRQYRRIRFLGGNSHTPSEFYSDPTLKCCNTNGVEVEPFEMAHKYLKDTDAVLNHYICKTIEEFITNKMVRLTGANPTAKTERERVNFALFLKYNTLTFEKLKYMHDKLPKECDYLLDDMSVCTNRFIPKMNLVPKELEKIIF